MESVTECRLIWRLILGSECVVVATTYKKSYRDLNVLPQNLKTTILITAM